MPVPDLFAIRFCVLSMYRPGKVRHAPDQFHLLKSEISEVLISTSEVLTDSMLVSAYDLYYAHLGKNPTFPTELVIVDSGGYETSEDHDFSAILRHTGKIDTWKSDMHLKQLDAWPSHNPAIFVSFDHGSIRKPFEEQIDDARALSSRYPKQMFTLLLKPTNKDQQFIDVSDLIRYVPAFSDFDVIGFTEKELGNSLIGRMHTIAKFRLAMDEIGVKAPIHIFGSLDPITSVLYFMAGAEIFDGLTWIRYSYHQGKAVYYHNYGAIMNGLQERDALVKAKSLVDNVYYLRNLQTQMERYLVTESFKVFEENETLLTNANEMLLSKMGRRK